MNGERSKGLDDDNSVELRDLMTELRSQIKQAVDQAKKDNMGVLFQLEDIEIELQTVIGTKGGAKGKFRVLGFEAELGAELSSAQTQKIKLKLSATGTSGGKIPLKNTEPSKPEAF